MRFPRLAVILYPLLIWLLSQAYFFWPEFLYVALGLSVALTIALTFLLKTAEHNKAWWIFAILPVSFLITITTYISLQASMLFVQILFFILLVFLFNYFKNLYYFWHRLDLYQEEDRNIINAYGGFLVIFLVAADLYGLQSLLGLTVWPMFLIFSVVAFVVTYLNLDLKGLSKKIILQFSLINTILILEMALVFIFLPLSYNVSALSIGIVYYLFINLTRLYLQQALTPKKIKLYLIISYAGLAILLLTARWLN